MHNLILLTSLFRQNNYSKDVRAKYDTKLGTLVEELKKEQISEPKPTPSQTRVDYCSLYLYAI